VRILFLCSRNRRRSLTAETVFKGHAGHTVRSAGTQPGARIQVSARHIVWADLIVAMEPRHVALIRRRFAAALTGKRIICLHIPDAYAYMDERLVRLLKDRLDDMLTGAAAGAVESPAAQVETEMAAEDAEKEESTMARSRQRTVLFLCTGNYYRSRFAECLFNATAARLGFSWRAGSRGLALERGVHNVGPMDASAVRALQALGITGESCTRLPAQAVAGDFEEADLVIALKEAEHRPLLQERFPAWAERVEYWHIEDADGVLPRIEHEVRELIARLLGGGQQPDEDADPAPVGISHVEAAEKPAAKPMVRVGRETKGRRGKGVTIVSDLPLDEAGVRELAARLKQHCGCGGTVKDGRIEIQGDHRQRLTVELERMGFQVKRTGG
jgi:protein-tyrosine phosphatase